MSERPTTIRKIGALEVDLDALPTELRNRYEGARTLADLAKSPSDRTALQRRIEAVEREVIAAASASIVVKAAVAPASATKMGTAPR